MILTNKKREQMINELANNMINAYMELGRSIHEAHDLVNNEMIEWEEMSDDRLREELYRSESLLDDLMNV